MQEIVEKTIKQRLKLTSKGTKFGFYAKYNENLLSWREILTLPLAILNKITVKLNFEKEDLVLGCSLSIPFPYSRSS